MPFTEHLGIAQQHKTRVGAEHSLDGSCIGHIEFNITEIVLIKERLRIFRQRCGKHNNMDVVLNVTPQTDNADSNIPLHLSTQTTTLNSDSVKFWADL